MDRTSLSRIERMNYIFGGALVALSGMLGTGEHLLGALVGVVLSAVNFTLVRRIVEKMMLAAKGQPQSRVSAIFLAPKLLVIMGAAGAAMYFLPISPVMLAVGFSVFMVSIGVETVRYVLLRGPDRDSDASPPSPEDRT
jgi:hypothetical protein